MTPPADLAMTEWIDFVLVPDRGAARRVRRALAEGQAWLGMQVGTWPELLELARASAVLPAPPDDWRERIASAVEALAPESFWGASLEVAPEDTRAVLERVMMSLLRALPPGTALEEGLAGAPLSPRAARHAAELARLQRALWGALPPDLATVRALLVAPGERWLRALRVTRVEGWPELDPWQRALLDRLAALASEAASDPVDPRMAQTVALLAAPGPAAAPDTALGQTQRQLFAPSAASAETIALDHTLQCWAVRDPLEALEVAAGSIQRALDADPQLALADVGLLLPEDPALLSAAHRVFDAAGLPLSGLAAAAPQRDLGHELVHDFLACQHAHAPALALASLLTSPLLPWDAETGMQLAQRVMEGRRPALAKNAPERHARALELLASGPPRDGAHLARRLRALPAHLHAQGDLAEHADAARELALSLAAELTERGDAPLDHDTLARRSAPRALAGDAESDHTREGLTVWHEGLEPWRPVRQLWVIDFSEAHFPASPGASPAWADDDQEKLAAAGLALDTPSRALSRARSVLQRQLRAVAERATLLVPHRSLAGEAQAPSSSAAFLARLFRGDDGQPLGTRDLSCELEAERGRQRAQGLAVAAPEAAAPRRRARVHDLALGRSLLEWGADDSGAPAPHSPSRLETLLVCPLAWLLERARLEPRRWQREVLDPLLQGSLAHAVFERVFAAGAPLPEEDALQHQVDLAFGEALARHAPFARAPRFRTECRDLRGQLERAARAWRQALAAQGARILASEVRLEGTLRSTGLAGAAATLPLRGDADAVLALPGGRLQVVDYKKSSGERYRTRLETGHDLQASLYRCMLETGGPVARRDEQAGMVEALRAALESAPAIDILYYTLNDESALTDGLLPEPAPRRFQPFAGDVSAQAMAWLRRRLRELSRGEIALHHLDDEQRVPKATGLALYALDRSPLLRQFAHGTPAEEESA